MAFELAVPFIRDSQDYAAGWHGGMISASLALGIPDCKFNTRRWQRDQWPPLAQSYGYAVESQAIDAEWDATRFTKVEKRGA